MSSSWVNGALKIFFGISRNTPDWSDAKAQMENAFGDIKINKAITGKIQAFFATQTLVGNDNVIETDRYKHTSTILDMEEAVGTGKDDASAVLDLWNKLTTLEPHGQILQVKDNARELGETLTLYKGARFSNGAFEEPVLVKDFPPPARPGFIEQLLSEDSILRVKNRLQNQLFGDGPKGSGN